MEISKQLADLFNLPFMTGVFPSVLKTAKVGPVFKKDSKLDYSNYHLIPCYQILKKHLKSSCIRNCIPFSISMMLSTTQFGFRQQYFTSHALINLTENIRKSLDDGYIGCGVFVNLQDF